jgi:hypothetical protein
VNPLWLTAAFGAASLVLFVSLVLETPARGRAQRRIQADVERAMSVAGTTAIAVVHGSARFLESGQPHETTGVVFAGPGRAFYAYRELTWLRLGSRSPAGATYSVLDLDPAAWQAEWVGELGSRRGAWLSLTRGAERHYVSPDPASEAEARKLLSFFPRVAPPPAPASPEPGKPLLAIESRVPGLGCLLPLVVCLGVACLLLGGAIAEPLGVSRSLMIPTAIVLGALGLFFADRFVKARTGRVVFLEEKIVIDRGATPVEVAWSDLDGYRDDAAHCVRLVRKGEVWSAARLLIPAVTEAQRTAVLALLDQKGVRRMG